MDKPMKIRGDIERVNLSTGERFQRVTGDGESRLEKVPVEPSSPPATQVSTDGTGSVDKGVGTSSVASCRDLGTKVPVAATAGTAREFPYHDVCTIPGHSELATEVAQLRQELAKLYAAIGPMDEFDTVDDAIARVMELRQEREREIEFLQVKRERAEAAKSGSTASAGACSRRASAQGREQL